MEMFVENSSNPDFSDNIQTINLKLSSDLPR